MTLMNGYMELAAEAGGQGDLLAALKACLADTKAVTVTTADDAPDGGPCVGVLLFARFECLCWVLRCLGSLIFPPPPSMLTRNDI